ncbi:kazrin-like isoform X2 [Mytilus edulis]|uniref:kazrin-like isoform X2 n=1 Tax=Mytilus edulis TaxID=6550 RepID=UPI0039EF1296
MNTQLEGGSPERINLVKAIQSLDCLNDQIVEYIFRPRNGEISFDTDLSPKHQDTLKSSMVLIRRLLHDAQSKFRKMVEDNKKLAARIDGSINAANQEVNSLRAELLDTNKKLTEISEITESTPQQDCGTKCDDEHINPKQRVDEDNEMKQLKEENSRLKAQNDILSSQENGKDINCDISKYGELKLELIQTKQELNRAKEALQAMKSDRKRLKAEKLELLNQMKQLYTTLEDKETELRDFIRNYQQKMAENDETIKQLAREREDTEQEKWEIIKQARDAQERAVILRTQLESKEQHIKKLEMELSVMKEQAVKTGYTLHVPSTPPTIRCTTPNSEDLPPYETPPLSANLTHNDSSFDAQFGTPKELRDRSNSLTPLIDSQNKSSISLPISETSSETKKKKRISLGSLSKVFTRGRVRRSIAIPVGTELEDSPSPSRITLLNPGNYQDKLKLVEQSRGCHMSTWKANQVLAWLEIVINMPMYGKTCSENVKSGKVLLGLSDSELGSALCITNPMHRKKIRLAVEEQRNPGEAKYPKSSRLDHTWIAHRWIPDLGLSQYKCEFENNLVDGRILNILSKKEMEKHLNIHRKFHHASVLHAVELLRRLNFDKEVLIERRSKSEEGDTDPLVWTNERVIKWVQSIDLEEYAENLKDSGVHGAILVLEPQFNADTLATALGIPPSKSYIRRHLKTELESLVKPARDNLTLNNSFSTLGRNSTLGRSFRGPNLDTSGSKTRISFRGSLGRAFGRKVKEDLNKLTIDVETPKRKISAPSDFKHNTLQSVFEQEITPKTNSS